MTLFRNQVMTGQHPDFVHGIPAEQVTAGDTVCSPFKDGGMHRVEMVVADDRQVMIHLVGPAHEAWCVSKGREMLVTV